MSAHCSVLASLVAFVGRVFFAFIFIVAGIYKIVFFNKTMLMMTQAGIPHAEWVLIVGLVFELLGGLLVLLGWYTRFGAFLLFVFIIPATYFFHSFWLMTGPEQMFHIQHVLKNLALMGGACFLMAFGGGSLSVDGACRKNIAVIIKTSESRSE